MLKNLHPLTDKGEIKVALDELGQGDNYLDHSKQKKQTGFINMEHRPQKKITSI